jgi:hypothetical protein
MITPRTRSNAVSFVLSALALVLMLDAAPVRSETGPSAQTVGGTQPAAAPESSAPQTPTPQTSTGQNKVKLGLFVSNISSLDMAKQTFDITFWAWFLTPDKNYRPIESVEVVNAKTLATKFTSIQTKEKFPWGGGTEDVAWTQGKYSVSVSNDWNTSNYPFDRHKLVVSFEDAVNDSEAIALVPDVENSRLDGNIKIPGWNIKSFELKSGINEYPTNYGDSTAKSSSSYSRIDATIVVERRGLQILFSMFTGFFVAFMLTFITYCMGTHKMGSSRLGLAAAAVFAAIGNKNSVDNILPVSPEFTIVDAIEMSTFGAIILAIGVAVFIMWGEEKHPKAVTAVNKITAVLSVLIYVGFIGYRILRAVA